MKKLLLGLLLFAGPAFATALQTAIADHDKTTLATLLADSGTDLTETFSATLKDGLVHDNLQPLMYAVYLGRVTMSTMIITAMQAKETATTWTHDQFLAAINAEDSLGWTAYLFAVRHANLTLMAALEAVGADSYSSAYNRTRLMVASVYYKSDNLNFLTWLAGDSSVLEQAKEARRCCGDDGDGRNALMMSLEKNVYTAPAILLQAVADSDLDTLLNQRDQNGRTALMYTVIFQTAQTLVPAVSGVKALQLLLTSYATASIDGLDLQDDVCMTALMYAAQNNDAATIQDLLTAGADQFILDDQDRFALQHATTDVSKRLLVSGLDNNGATTLIRAAQIENEEHSLAAVNAILAVTDAKGDRVVDINAYDNDGMSALMYAIDHRHTTVISALLNAGVDLATQSDVEVDSEEYINITAIMYAIIVANHTVAVYNAQVLNPIDECLGLLLTVNTARTNLAAAVNVRDGYQVEEDGLTALMYAVKFYNGPAVYALVRITDLDLDMTATTHIGCETYENQTALMYALRMDHYLDCDNDEDYYGIIAQLTSQARFTRIDYYEGGEGESYNPIFYALLHSNASAVESILKANADLRKTLTGDYCNIGCVEDVTPLIVAVRLADHCVDEEGDLDTFVSLILNTNKENTHLAEAIDMAQTDHDEEDVEQMGRTALFYGISKKNFPIVRALRLADADLETESDFIFSGQEYETLSPLMYAVIKAGDHDSDSLQYAIYHEIASHVGSYALNKVEATTGFTPLMFAIKNHNEDIVDDLLTLGASLTTRYSGPMTIDDVDMTVTNFTPLMYAIVRAECTSYTSVWDDYSEEVLNDVDAVVDVILSNEVAAESRHCWLNLRDGNPYFEDGFSALMYAVLMQNGPALYALMQLCHIEYNTKSTVMVPLDGCEATKYYNVTPLMYAVLLDNELGCESNEDTYYIIRTLADVDPCSIDEREGLYSGEQLIEGSGWNALMFAIDFDNSEAVDAIANEDTDLEMRFSYSDDCEDYERITPIMFAIIKSDQSNTAIYDGESIIQPGDTIRNLLESDNCSLECALSKKMDAPYDNFTALLLAIKKHNGPAVKLLIDNGANEQQETSITYNFHCDPVLGEVEFPTMTPILYSILRAGSGQNDGCYEHSPEYQIPAYIVDNIDGCTPEVLNRQDLKWSCEDYYYHGTGWNALMCAIKNDNLDLVELLLDYNADNYASYNHVLGNILPINDFELKTHYADITPLIFVALAGNNSCTTKQIAVAVIGNPLGQNSGYVYNHEISANINYQDMQGRTAYMYASMNDAGELKSAIEDMWYWWDDEGWHYAQYEDFSREDAYDHNAAYYQSHLGDTLD